jgi:hypothetical protein
MKATIDEIKQLESEIRDLQEHLHCSCCRPKVVRRLIGKKERRLGELLDVVRATAMPADVVPAITLEDAVPEVHIENIFNVVTLDQRMDIQERRRELDRMQWDMCAPPIVKQRVTT